MKSILTPRLAFVTVAVVAAALTRFLPHPPNFTAIGAMALFAGACLPSRWLSLLIPAAAMLVTDAIIGFHPTLWAVYVAFAATTMMGWTMRRNQNPFSILGLSLASAVLFFLVTNSAMWVTDHFMPADKQFYPLGIEGLGTSITAGIPFFANTLISQFAYGAILFGAFHAVKVWRPNLVRA